MSAVASKDERVAAVTTELERLIGEAAANVAALLAILDPAASDLPPADTEGAMTP